QTFEDPYAPLEVYLTAWDPDWHSVTVSIVSGPSHGTLIHTNTWPLYFYTPDTNWFGTDTITFVASDGMATSAPGTVTITVWSMDDPPVPIDQTVSTPEETPVTFAIQANDVEGDPITWVQIVAWPTN